MIGNSRQTYFFTYYTLFQDIVPNLLIFFLAKAGLQFHPKRCMTAEQNCSGPALCVLSQPAQSLTVLKTQALTSSIPLMFKFMMSDTTIHGSEPIK